MEQEDWGVELEAGRTDRAWDLFIGRYRRVIFSAIRHYARDYDDVMDVFARVCEGLRENDCSRLRAYIGQTDHRARFSTWLVTVVRNLTVDWFRHRDGRKRLSSVVEALPDLQRRIFQHVFHEQRSHVEAFELIRTGHAPGLTFGHFLRELRVMYGTLVGQRRGALMMDALVTPPSVEPDHSDVVEREQTRTALSRALDALAPDDKVAVQMYLIDGVAAADIATVLGLTTKAVYNRIYRALAALREHLEGAGLTRGDL